MVPVAEPAAVAPSESAASERDVLLATKLYMPGSRTDLVSRPRLAERLDEGLGQGLVLVCAPAGYGKTVLLADWARHGRHPAAWLSLDAGDNDPVRFWRHVLAALDQIHEGIAGRVGPLAGPRRRPRSSDSSQRWLTSSPPGPATARRCWSSTTTT